MEGRTGIYICLVSGICSCFSVNFLLLSFVWYKWVCTRPWTNWRWLSCTHVLKPQILGGSNTENLHNDFCAFGMASFVLCLLKEEVCFSSSLTKFTWQLKTYFKSCCNKTENVWEAWTREIVKQCKGNGKAANKTIRCMQIHLPGNGEQVGAIVENFRRVSGTKWLTSVKLIS